MIKIMLGSWFGLPRLGPDAFSRLMRQAKLRYDRERRMFLVEPQTNVAMLVSILKEALKDSIVIELPCFVCGRSAGCSECEFLEVCDRTAVSAQCICRQCMEKEGSYRNYGDALLSKLKAAKVKI